MTTLKAVSTVENMVKKILSDRASETEALVEQVEKEDQAIAAANSAMEKATTAGDVKAYQKAKAERRDASDAKEMHEARLNALNHKPLISKADYEKAVAEIYSEVAAVENQSKQRIAELSEKMEGEALFLQEAVNAANRALHGLQHDVYRDADRRRDSNGDVLFLAHDEKKIEKWDTINWGRTGVMNLQYLKYTGRKVQ